MKLQLCQRTRHITSPSIIIIIIISQLQQDRSSIRPCLRRVQLRPMVYRMCSWRRIFLFTRPARTSLHRQTICRLPSPTPTCSDHHRLPVWLLWLWLLIGKQYMMRSIAKTENNEVVMCKIKHLQNVQICFRAVDFPRLCRGCKMLQICNIFANVLVFNICKTF